MPYGNPIQVGLSGGGAGIEAGQLPEKAFTNALRNSQLLTAAGWASVDGATVAPVVFTSDLPVGGKNAYRITDTSAVASSALEQVAALPASINGDGSERPLHFSFYCALEAYAQTAARAEALITLANANTILFSADFNPSNGAIGATNFSTTEPGFSSAECSVFVNPFEGENGVSAFRITLIVFTRGLSGLSAIASLRLRIYPDVVDPTTVGNFIDVTGAQIAVPFGITNTVDFGLPPYHPTWDVAQPAQNSKTASNALDLSLHLSAVSVSPYQFCYYADLGVAKQVTVLNQNFALPPISSDVPDGWWTLVGSPTSLGFDIDIAVGQNLVQGGAVADVPGPATVNFTDTNVFYWKLVKLSSTDWGIFPYLTVSPASGGSGGGGPVNMPFAGTANVAVNHGVVGATETTIVPAGVGSVIIPAGSLAVGDTYRLTAEGVHTTHPVTPTGGYKYRSRLNGALIAESPKAGSFVTIGTGLTDAPWRAVLDFTVRSIGVGGTIMVKGYTMSGTTDQASTDSFGFGYSTATVAVDTTIAQTLDLTFAYGSAIGNLGTVFTMTNFMLEKLTP